MFPSLAGSVRLSDCLQFICRRLQQFICLPVWLVVSGSPVVFNSLVSQFVTQSGRWCPALWLSVFTCLPSLISQSGWWCAALLMFLFACFAPLVFPVLWSARLSGCSSLLDSFHVFPIAHCVSLVSQFVPQFVPQYASQFVAQFVSQFVSCPSLSLLVCLPMLSLPAGSWPFEPCLL